MSEQEASVTEAEWITWARIALKYEGVEAALSILGFYLALHPAENGATR